MAKETIERRIGKGRYQDFIEWGFTEDPSQRKLDEVPLLWKHHDKEPISLNDGLSESIDRMCRLYKEERGEEKE